MQLGIIVDPGLSLRARANLSKSNLKQWMYMDEEGQAALEQFSLVQASASSSDDADGLLAYMTALGQGQAEGALTALLKQMAEKLVPLVVGKGTRLT
mmetsp:Transcript_23985/g.52488  ORF Transcript_23985/g.52488 Transcript_23985/m.52488 type:complete len:97 (-) Transcript_23985:461-751(-)